MADLSLFSHTISFSYKIITFFSIYLSPPFLQDIFQIKSPFFSDVYPSEVAWFFSLSLILCLLVRPTTLFIIQAGTLDSENEYH